MSTEAGRYREHRSSVGRRRLPPWRRL